MNLENLIKQLRQELEHIQAALAVLENLQRKRQEEIVRIAAQRKHATAKKKAPRPALADERQED